MLTVQKTYNHIPWFISLVLADTVDTYNIKAFYFEVKRVQHGDNIGFQLILSDIFCNIAKALLARRSLIIELKTSNLF